MLAAKATDEQIRGLFWGLGKLLASPKLDGIRCTIQSGVALSRTLKPIRNKHIQSVLGHDSLNGLDGELIIGSPTAKDVYTRTVSDVMRTTGEPEFMFYVFDDINSNKIYRERYKDLHANHPSIKILRNKLITSMGELYDYEQECLTVGYEGVILRDVLAKYKHGRSTAKQGELLKVKRFEDGEAAIIGMEELMHNANEATTNELGRTQRSSHKENKVPTGTMGALVCRDLETGIEFNIGTGFTDEMRAEFWFNKEGYMENLLKYKSFKIGVKDKPRHPVFLGMRDPSDM